MKYIFDLLVLIFWRLMVYIYVDVLSGYVFSIICDVNNLNVIRYLYFWYVFSRVRIYVDLYVF